MGPWSDPGRPAGYAGIAQVRGAHYGGAAPHPGSGGSALSCRDFAHMNRTADALATGLPDDIELTTAAGSRASLVAVAGAHSYPRILLAAALVAITYGLTARLGAALHFPDVPVSAIWAPNAVLLAALLLVPRRYWWIYLAVLFPVHLLVQVSLTHTPLPQVLIQYGVNCATALIAAFALNAFVPHLQRIDRMRTAVAFIVLAGFVAPIFSSVLMAAAFVALHI